MKKRGEKVRILLTGKLEGHSVFCLGNPYLPQSTQLTRFRAVVEEMDDILVELGIAMTSGHVYRFSDIPNRHGHCASNPYRGAGCNCLEGQKCKKTYR